MAAEIIWLDDAKDDVRTILQYIAAENPSAALGYVAALTQCCERLADFPHSGRRYNSSFRYIVFRNHLVFYRVMEQDSQVRITAVIDGRRDIEKLLGEKD